jgi:pimeloyl-ACP methyl ester carboxylesterase
MNQTSHIPQVSHAFATVDGRQVFYRRAGHPARPTLVLLHGFPSSSHMYRDLMPLLADQFDVIAPDYIGFGHSDAPLASEFVYSFAHLTEVVEQLLVQLGVTRYYLYMQDYGGPIGMRIASKHPERVLGLVVQNANAYMAGVSEAAANIFMPLWERGDDTGARQMLLAETTRYQYQHGARNPAALNPDAWLHDQALLDRPGSAERQLALFRDYQSNVAAYPAWHAYFQAHQPRTLILWGKADPFFIAPGAQAYLDDLPEARLVWLDGGHFPTEEHAPAIAAEIKAFFPQ